MKDDPTGFRVGVSGAREIQPSDPEYGETKYVEYIQNMSARVEAVRKSGVVRADEMGLL